jgi:hypothetical protein
MNKTLRVFLVNAIFLTFGYVGLSIMDDMYQDEHSVTVAEFHQQARAAKTEMVKADLAKRMAAFDRCTTPDKPFLTDHILIVGTVLGGMYYTGEVTEVTMKQAFAAPKGTTQVLAYCE